MNEQSELCLVDYYRIVTTSEDRYSYILNFNFEYNGNNNININTIEFSAKSYYDKYNFHKVTKDESYNRRPFYVNGDNTYNISILLPKMVLTLPITIERSNVFKDQYTTKLYTKLVIELTACDKYEGTILITKTYSLQDLRKMLQKIDMELKNLS